MSEAAATFTELRGVLLPLKEAQLLLPSASISEIVGYYQPIKKSGSIFLTIRTLSVMNGLINLLFIDRLIRMIKHSFIN